MILADHNLAIRVKITNSPKIYSPSTFPAIRFGDYMYYVYTWAGGVVEVMRVTCHSEVAVLSLHMLLCSM